MKTPVGKECKYFFGDYFRGRSVEECDLLKVSNQSWSADLCRTCPVPGILQANACEFLQLHATVSRPLANAFHKRVQITAYCEKAKRSVDEPYIGCGECHPLPPILEIKSK